VFEQVQINELGIRAVKPAEEYLPLVAIATGGYRGGEPGLPLHLMEM
jgi:hypothetical protein